MIEVMPSGQCDCSQLGRSAVPPALVSPVFKLLRESNSCGAATGQRTCDAANFCLCQINQETGDDLSSCVANAPTTTPGFCYIDDPSSTALRRCPASQQQTLRFIAAEGTQLPAEGALLYLACPGAPI